MKQLPKLFNIVRRPQMIMKSIANLFSWFRLIYTYIPIRSMGLVYVFTNVHHLQSRWLATPKRWRIVRGHDKLIHGSCAIYFPGGKSKYTISPIQTPPRRYLDPKDLKHLNSGGMTGCLGFGEPPAFALSFPWVFLRTRPGGGTGAPRKEGAGNKGGLPSPVGPTQQGQQGRAVRRGNTRSVVTNKSWPFSLYRG